MWPFSGLGALEGLYLCSCSLRNLFHGLRYCQLPLMRVKMIALPYLTRILRINAVN